VEYPYKKEKTDFPPSDVAFANGLSSWVCKGCGATLSQSIMSKNQYVCPQCAHHHAISSYDRILHLVDSGSFEETNRDLLSSDPLSFPGYKEKLEGDKAKTTLKEAVVTGKGAISGFPLMLGVMDARFRMGSMGAVVGEKITRAIEQAIHERIPFVLFCASGGARMQEGIFSLMQMAKTSVALAKMNEEGLLFVSVLTNPTTGGVSASFASLGDINLAEPQALIGFAGRRIIEQTINEKLPDDFQTAEFLLAHGQLDKVVDRREMKNTLSTILKLHQKPKKEVLYER